MNNTENTPGTKMGQPKGFWSRSFPAVSEQALRRYLAGQLVSFIGSWSQNVALNLLVYQFTKSAWLLGILNFLLYGPMLLVAPMAGGWLSLQRVKGILLAVLAGNAAVSGMLWWYAASGQDYLPLLFALALVSGTLSAIELPSRLVFITAFLRDHALMSNALSLNVLANNFARMAGAPIGAALFSTYGPEVAFAACMFALVFMVLSVGSIPVAVRAGLRHRSAGLLEGLRYVISEPFASFFLPTIGLMGLFAGSYPTLVPILGGLEFGNASRYTGLFLSCAGAGAVVSSIVLASRFSAYVASHFIRFSHWTACAALAGISIAPDLLTASLSFLTLGGVITFTNTASSAAMLQRAPEGLRGPLAGLYSMAFAGVLPFGHLLAGALSTYFDIRTTFLIMSIGLVGVLLLLVFLHRRIHGTDSLRPRS